MKEALDRLFKLGQGRMLPGRDRLSRLLSKAGDPHLAVPSILVGGTNGKGSVVAGLSAALSPQMATGAFLKPHLVSIRERWRINDTPVEPGRLVDAINEACNLIDAHGEEISFFEANVLIGALLFKQAGCELAIWEVGLGGKEDACNLADPLVSVLTGVGLDHQAILGDTVEEIALDKAHIARPGRPLVLGSPRPGYENSYRKYTPVVEAHCIAVGANLVRCKAPLDEQWDGFINAGGTGIPPDAESSVKAALEQLQAKGIQIDTERAMAGMRGKYHYPGRMDMRDVRGKPVLFDAAHNQDSLRWLAYVLSRKYAGKRLPVVFGCQSTRNPEEMLAEIKGLTGILAPIEIPVLRPCPAGEIAGAAKNLGIEVAQSTAVRAVSGPELPIGHVTELDPPDNSTGWIQMFEYALELADGDTPLVVCGSIYYIGEIMRVFAPRGRPCRSPGRLM